jgi:hypothetical protein
VYKLQNSRSRLKYKPFLLEVADYWAGMSLEETHEEKDVEGADEGDDPSPPAPQAPRRDPVGRLSGDMEHQLQAIVGVAKRKYPQKPCRVRAANKKCQNARCTCICKPSKISLHKGDCFMRYHTRMKC